jgi:hypothetical protein
MTGMAEAQRPALSVSLVPPATLQCSWASNFTSANWQLTSTTNLASPNWQAVTQMPFTSNNTLVVFVPFTNFSGFFRLQQVGGSCMFQAVPPVITNGGSSTLNWCPATGTTYFVSPGSVVVTNGSLPVSPAATTVYTLTASNSLGITLSYATIIVNPCGWLDVSNWDATVTFSYALAPGTSQYTYNLNQQAQVTYHLTRLSVSSTNAAFSNYAPSGTVSENDVENNLTTGIPTVTTVVGSGPPLSLPYSSFILIIDCPSGTYSFSFMTGVLATETITQGTASSSNPLNDIVGEGVVVLHSLPNAASTISDSELLPARSPSWSGGGDFFEPGSVLSGDMFALGVATDFTAGYANVNWSLTPVP